MEIVIYDCRQSNPQPAPAEAVVLPIAHFKPNLLIVKLTRNLGYNLLIIALIGVFYAAAPALVRETKYRLGPKMEEVTARASFNQIIKNEEITKQKLASEEAAKYGVLTDFSIVIPKIEAKAKIVPNVHPGDKEEYTAALKQGVAHASASSFPGQKGTIYLFSHSTNTELNVERYNAVFYLLKELGQEDKIIIFYAGFKHSYQVTEKQIVAADDTGWLTQETNEERLVLQTCWPPGTSLKRLIVIAKPV